MRFEFSIAFTQLTPQKRPTRLKKPGLKISSHVDPKRLNKSDLDHAYRQPLG